MSFVNDTVDNYTALTMKGAWWQGSHTTVQFPSGAVNSCGEYSMMMVRIFLMMMMMMVVMLMMMMIADVGRSQMRLQFPLKVW